LKECDTYRRVLQMKVARAQPAEIYPNICGNLDTVSVMALLHPFNNPKIARSPIAKCL